MSRVSVPHLDRNRNLLTKLVKLFSVIVLYRIDYVALCKKNMDSFGAAFSGKRVEIEGLTFTSS